MSQDLAMNQLCQGYTKALSITLPKSTAAVQSLSPRSPRRSSATARAQRSKALEGTQPTLRQSPSTLAGGTKQLLQLRVSNNKHMLKVDPKFWFNLSTKQLFPRQADKRWQKLITQVFTVLLILLKFDTFSPPKTIMHQPRCQMLPAPPARCCSINALLAPRRADCLAETRPPAPAPTATKS